MELLAGEERSHAAAACRQALASSGLPGRAACHGAHVEAAERWMAPGRWGWTGSGRDRLIGAPVLKPRETAVTRR
jgi:hypothetical protein